jgi:hypothetical protein
MARKRVDLFDPAQRRAAEARAERKVEREAVQKAAKVRNARKLAAERSGALAPAPMHPTEKRFADEYPQEEYVPAPAPAPAQPVSVVVEAPPRDDRLVDALEKFVSVEVARLALEMTAQEWKERQATRKDAAPPAAEPLAVNVVVQQGPTETLPFRDGDGLIERSVTRPLGSDAT